MPDYRVYRLDYRDRITSGEDVLASDDAAVIRLISDREERCELEIWLGSRQVGVVPAATGPGSAPA